MKPICPYPSLKDKYNGYTLEQLIEEKERIYKELEEIKAKYDMLLKLDSVVSWAIGIAEIEACRGGK